MIVVAVIEHYFFFQIELKLLCANAFQILVLLHLSSFVNFRPIYGVDEVHRIGVGDIPVIGLGYFVALPFLGGFSWGSRRGDT